jgi:hypothetical protein
MSEDSVGDRSERSFLLTSVFGFGALQVLAAVRSVYQIRIANFMLFVFLIEKWRRPPRYGLNPSGPRDHWAP